MIKNHIGSWSNPQCTVNNCLKSPIKILRVKAGWDIPSGEPHPYQGREQWSDFDYLPCNDHVTMVIDYLVGREFPRESIIELGGAEEIRKRQLKDIEDERNTELKGKGRGLVEALDAKIRERSNLDRGRRR